MATAMRLSEEDMGELKNHMNVLIDGLNSKNKQRTASLLKVLKKSKDEIRALDKRQLLLEEENRYLRHQVTLLGKEVSDIVGRERAANLIVYGLEEKVDEDENLAFNVVEEFKKVDINISIDEVVNAGRIGVPNENKKRPVLLKLAQPSIKRKIFEKGRELYSKQKLSVNNDMTRTQRMEKKELMEVKKLFDEAGIPVKIKIFFLLWHGTALNRVQALELFNELKDNEYKDRNKTHEQVMQLRSRADSEQEEILSEDSAYSNCSQESDRGRKRRATFSQRVLESEEVRKRQHTKETRQQEKSRTPQVQEDNTRKPKK